MDLLGAEHAELEPHLRVLLSRIADSEARPYLETLPKFDADSLDIPDIPDISSDGDQSGDVVGPYRLLRELGSGGMGVVWLAERTDGFINRPVALKLPHGAWKRAGLAERMARERNILATLTHPNIARLYDAGLTAQGQPFLAIEYVEGQPIDAYCRERQLDLKARLRLFLQVAQGVAYAHAKLVVHRDLKPANILVTGDGQVRLLDFGIAKLMEEGQAQDVELTEFSSRALTPAYASPEQILGKPVAVASDVYSLGVILYELVCGQRPYKLKYESRGSIEEAILHAEPALPSETAERQWRGALRGDLDAIMLATLAKTPEERYETAHALIDDIERFLTGRPVRARPDSAWYRVRKFVRRNRLAVSAASVVFAAMVIGASAVAWQARVALAERARAEQVKEFIASVFREADPTQGQGKILSGADLLRQAERRLSDRADVGPDMRVELLAIIGESLFGLQESADSARVLEQAVRLQRESAAATDDVSARLHLVLSQAYEILGKHDEARREIERSFAMLTAARDSLSRVFIQAKLQQSALGIVFAEYPLAEQAAHDAIVTAAKTLGPRSAEAATALQRLSHVYSLTQRRDQAIEPARQSYEMQLELHAGDVAHPAVVESTVYYAQALHTSGDFDGASALYSDAVAKAASVFGPRSRSLGEALSAAVPVQIDVGDLKAAIASARRAVEIYLIEGERESPTHAGRVRKLGSALLAARSSGEAAQQLEEALRLAVAAKVDLEALHARGSLGLALAYLGRFLEADRHLREAIDKSSRTPRAHHLAARNLGASLRLQGRYVEALPWLSTSLEESSVQASHRGDHAQGLLESGLTRLELGDFDAAEQLFARARTLFEDVQKHHVTPARADLFLGMARVSLQRGDRESALKFAQTADAFWRDFDPDSRSAGEAALWLGRCHLANGRRAPAVEALTRADRLLSRSPIPSDVGLRRLTRDR